MINICIVRPVELVIRRSVASTAHPGWNSWSGHHPVLTPDGVI
jgi:hypothetical protein